MTEPAEQLRSEIAELRREMAELQAVIRAALTRRRSKKVERAQPVSAAPEVRKSVRDKMIRGAARSKR